MGLVVGVRGGHVGRAQVGRLGPSRGRPLCLLVTPLYAAHHAQDAGSQQQEGGRLGDSSDRVVRQVPEKPPIVPRRGDWNHGDTPYFQFVLARQRRSERCGGHTAWTLGLE